MTKMLNTTKFEEEKSEVCHHIKIPQYREQNPHFKRRLSRLYDGNPIPESLSNILHMI